MNLEYLLDLFQCTHITVCELNYNSCCSLLKTLSNVLARNFSRQSVLIAERLVKIAKFPEKSSEQLRSYNIMIGDTVPPISCSHCL